MYLCSLNSPIISTQWGCEIGMFGHKNHSKINKVNEKLLFYGTYKILQVKETFFFYKNGFLFNQTTINSALTQDIDGKDIFTVKH